MRARAQTHMHKFSGVSQLQSRVEGLEKKRHLDNKYVNTETILYGLKRLFCPVQSSMGVSSQILMRIQQNIVIAGCVRSSFLLVCSVLFKNHLTGSGSCNIQVFD